MIGKIQEQLNILNAKIDKLAAEARKAKEEDKLALQEQLQEQIKVLREQAFHYLKELFEKRRSGKNV